MPTTNEYVAAGLYDPSDDAATGRLDLLEWLACQGFTVDEMIVALETDGLGAMAGDRRLSTGAWLSRSEAIAISELSTEDFDAYATAFGYLPLDGAPQGDLAISAEQAKALAVFGALAPMFSDAEALSFIRVIGNSIGRIAEAAVSLFLTDVESPMLASGQSELDLAVKVDEAVGLLDGFAEQLDSVLKRHVLQAIQRSRRSIIDMNERLRYRYAVGFVDLVGFTEISEHMDSKELANFIRDFEGRAHDVVTQMGARVVKLIGDEVMFVATDPTAACRAASALMLGIGCEHEQVLPRGGLAYGDVLVRGGDYYGSVVNLASRLVNEAVPQELLVTEALAEATEDGGQIRFEPAGRRMVKGFADPITVRSLFAGEESVERR
jgi:adenylate cyclase